MARVFLIGLAYFFAHQIAFSFPDSAKVTMLVWPAGGVGLAAFLMNPRRLWPALALALSIAAITANVFLAHRSFLTAAGYMTGNMVESIGCAWLILRWAGGFRAFSQAREVLALLVGTIFVNAFSSCIGAGTAVLDRGTSFAGTWWSWYVADGLGGLLIGAFLVAWISNLRGAIAGLRSGKAIESVACLLVWSAVCLLTFYPGILTAAAGMHPYVLVALLAWPALRLGMRGVTLSLVLLFAVAVASPAIVNGPCPWDATDANQSSRLLELQLFVGFLAVVGYLLAAGRADSRRAEEQLWLSEQHYRALVDQAADGIFVMNCEGEILEVNDAFATMHGYTAKELMAIGLAGFDPDSKALFPARMSRILAGETLLFEVEHLRKDGSRFPLEVSVSLVEIGDKTCIMAFHRDITERKRAAEVLRESESKHRDLFDAAADSIFVHDLKGRMLAVNPFACERLGYTHAELMAMTVDHVDSPAEAPQAPERIAHLMQRGSLSFETVHQAKDGSLVPTEVNSRRITWGGQPAMLSICRDVTGRKALEAQLLQAQKMEAIGRLAGGVAHDFRNQLTVIMGYGQMLIRRNLVTDEGRAMLEEILKAAERSSTITGQLLAFSRKETLCPSVQSIRDVIADIGKILPHMVGEDVRMMIQSSTDACQANIDAHLFQQAIMNLATNARDAMPKGGTLTIETACVALGAESRQIDPELAEGPYVVVTVSDTGNGMDAATLAKVFDPFFTTKEVGKGTGLGLAMVYGFVKQSGGAVAMQSELGRGTTTRLYFPLAAASPTAVLGGQLAGGLQGGGETILLVEDEPEVRAMAAALLREAGYRVLEAPDAEEALLLAERCDGDIDVLVTDVVMPGMSGAALAERLQGRYPGLKVLYMSGYPGDELSQHGVSDPMGTLDKPFAAASLLAKPFAAASLLAKIRQSLDARQNGAGK